MIDLKQYQPIRLNVCTVVQDVESFIKASKRFYIEENDRIRAIDRPYFERANKVREILIDKTGLSNEGFIDLVKEITKEDEVKVIDNPIKNEERAEVKEERIKEDAKVEVTKKEPIVTKPVTKAQPKQQPPSQPTLF
jgi:hypothetical protein